MLKCFRAQKIKKQKQYKKDYLIEGRGKWECLHLRFKRSKVCSRFTIFWVFAPDMCCLNAESSLFLYWRHSKTQLDNISAPSGLYCKRRAKICFGHIKFSVLKQQHYFKFRQAENQRMDLRTGGMSSTFWSWVSVF